jgi:hypothetical protein
VTRKDQIEGRGRQILMKKEYRFILAGQLPMRHAYTQNFLDVGSGKFMIVFLFFFWLKTIAVSKVSWTGLEATGR